MKKIPWWEPQVGKAEEQRVLEVLKSQYLNEGDLTAEFEAQLAQLLGVRHVVCVTSGTAAIFLSLAALGVGAGDEVLVPDATFIATANAVTLSGATPVLVDIDPTTLNIDPQDAITKITSKTKAIIPVHVSGRAAAIDDILQIAKGRGLFVVEDAAEAFMSKWHGKSLGSFASTGCLSFSPHKIITTGQGGAIMTNDDRLHQRLIELKDQGRSKRGTGGDDLHPAMGYNFKFTNLQAAVGLGQLTVLSERIAHIQETLLDYRQRLEHKSGIELLPFDLNAGEVPLWIDAIVDRRDALDDFLRRQNIFCRRFWFPLHQQEPYRAPDNRFPNSTKALQKALWLPSAFTLNAEDRERVCHQICAFLDGTVNA